MTKLGGRCAEVFGGLDDHEYWESTCSLTVAGTRVPQGVRKYRRARAPTSRTRDTYYLIIWTGRYSTVLHRSRIKPGKSPSSQPSLKGHRTGIRLIMYVALHYAPSSTVVTTRTEGMALFKMMLEAIALTDWTQGCIHFHDSKILPRMTDGETDNI